MIDTTAERDGKCAGLLFYIVLMIALEVIYLALLTLPVVPCEELSHLPYGLVHRGKVLFAYGFSRMFYMMYTVWDHFTRFLASRTNIPPPLPSPPSLPATL